MPIRHVMAQEYRPQPRLELHSNPFSDSFNAKLGGLTFIKYPAVSRLRTLQDTNGFDLRFHAWLSKEEHTPRLEVVRG